ncbi:MAG: PEP-CTERM sorting domain-containing protein [Phycisphaerales bacterium]
MTRLNTTLMLAATVSLSGLTQSAGAETLLFDFGHTNVQTNPGWNNVIPATTTLFATFDSTNTLTSIGFEITDTFFQTGEPSQLGSEAPAGDAAAYPVSATDDYFFGHTTAFAGADPNPLGQFKLFNLDPTKTYNFTFFASRQTVTDIRDSSYDITGGNSGSGVLDASNNNTEVLKINGIVPDGNNEIYVDVTPGPNNNNANGFFYIGLMQVDIVPEPASLSLLGAAGLTLLGRRRSLIGR